MKNLFLTLFVLTFLVACQRNIESGTYTANTMGVVIEGEVVSARQITVQDAERLQDNKAGGLIGGLAGGIGSNNIGKGRGRTAATVGGAVLGAAIGAAAQNYLSQQQAMEYIVKVAADEAEQKTTTRNFNLNQSSVENRLKTNIETAKYKTKLISVVQGMDETFQKGDLVYVIYNDDTRARLISR